MKQKRKARTGINPKTQQKIKIPAKTVIKFRVSKAAKDATLGAAAWSRWKGVKDWDSYELAEKYPQWASAVCGIRGTATNHVIGDSWSSWWIPLKGGDVSVGVVFDQRIANWPQADGKLGDRLKKFLIQHPVGREMGVAPRHRLHKWPRQGLQLWSRHRLQSNMSKLGYGIETYA